MNEQPQSETPRTDAHEHFVASFSPKYCDPEFCRTLERELTAERAARTKAEEALDGRLNNDCGRDPIEMACKAYVEAENELPDEFDSEDFTLGNAIRELVSERDQLRTDLARYQASNESIAAQCDGLRSECAEFRARYVERLERCNMVITERDTLRAQLAAVTAERDALREPSVRVGGYESIDSLAIGTAEVIRSFLQGNLMGANGKYSKLDAAVAVTILDAFKQAAALRPNDATPDGGNAPAVCANHYSDGSKIFPNRDCCKPVEGVATPCFWPRCSDKERCAAFGSCVALFQNAHKADLAATAPSVTETAKEIIRKLHSPHTMEDIESILSRFLGSFVNLNAELQRSRDEAQETALNIEAERLKLVAECERLRKDGERLMSHLSEAHQVAEYCRTAAEIQSIRDVVRAAMHPPATDQAIHAGME